MADHQTESEFIERARAFLRDNLGKDGSGVDPDRDLLEAGVLDSLLLLSFLHFVEQARGSALVDLPDFRSGFSLRTAFQMVRA
jgi:hypothetical protein